MNLGVNSSEPGDLVPPEAEAMARLLANLSGRSVAGFFPDPVADLSLEKMMADPSLVPPLNVDMQLALFGDPHAAAQTILAAVIRSNAAERETILIELGGRDLDKGGFYSYLSGLIRSQWITTRSIAIDTIQQQIPEYRPRINSLPLEEWEMRDCFFTWFQILNLRPTPAQLVEAFRRLPIPKDSPEAPVAGETCS